MHDHVWTKGNDASRLKIYVYIAVLAACANDDDDDDDVDFKAKAFEIASVTFIDVNSHKC